MLPLRPYQQKMYDEVRDAWSLDVQNICAQLPTGGGKTVLFGTAIHDEQAPSCAIAHRRELVGQMSVTLARMEVRHRIIAPPATVGEIVRRQMNEVGRSWHDPNARCGVAGVDTLIRREPDRWSQSVKLWVTDEGHHLVRGNKWHKATELFPNARGLAVTATPLRADGKGLGRHADGVIDRLICGPSGRELINAGYLTEYRVFAPRTADLDLSDVPVSAATGDYSQPALVKAVGRSHIIGDVVGSYLSIARGKLGVTFAVSVEEAEKIAAAYRAEGVPAAMVSADTPELMRAEIIRRFARRELLQLVNVDLFGEGFDLPAIEVVSMARPTESYGLYAQQFGRALRIMAGKTHAIIIDHVGSVLRHGLPDAPRVWTLDRRERRSRSAPEDSVPLRACPQCTGVYERFNRACPYCGHVPVPVERSAPEYVDGDLLELSPDVLARLRAQGAEIYNEPKLPYGASQAVIGALHKHHRARRETQEQLRATIAWWAGLQRARGRDDSESYRRFYHGFGIDVATAQTLGTKEAEELNARIVRALATEGVTVP